MSLYDELKNAENPLKKMKTVLTNEAREKRILSEVTFELSPICNFSCPFCYAKKTPAQLKKDGTELLKFEDWKNIIDQLIEMKVERLSLTGGECMIYPDFARVYSYAYDKGFSLSFISNGSSLTPELLDLFSKKKPLPAVVTLYGASPETYEKVCGNADYYNKVTENVKKLVDADIDVVLQTTICKNNVDDLAAIKSFANELGVRFRYSDDLMASRESSTEKVAKYYADYDSYLKNLTKANAEKSATDLSANEQQDDKFYYPPEKSKIIAKGMPCGGGRTGCTITHRGEMQTCPTFDYIRIDTKGRKIADCWKELTKACDEIPRLIECQTCIHRYKCKQCVAIHYFDTGEFGKPSPRLCYKKLHPEEAKKLEEIYRLRMNKGEETC